MADPICRWRNATPETICEIIESLPKKEMAREDFRLYMQKSKWGEGFAHTIYQLACQTGLYYISDDNIFHPRFKKNISLREAENYLKFWFRKYYVPNPYTKKGFQNLEKPLFVVKTFEEVLKNQKKDIPFSDLCNQIFKDEIGELDIFQNAINRYSGTLKVENNRITLIMNGEKDMEINVDRNDRKAFFDNFTVSSLNFTLIHPLILYGPPGTGKTYKMQHEYIDKFAKEDRFITTFHQSFSYEEFVEGLKPVLSDKPDGDTSSDVKYKIEKGIFYKACERAAEIAGYEPTENETSLQKCIADVDRSRKMEESIKNRKIVLLCIDEINRANVSAVFGDLISLIEPSKRIGAKNEMIVQLPYSKESFAVPANLMIVGTMNTADRSIQLLDSALRRRFRFEELLPDYDKIENTTAKLILQKINARIRGLLDKDHQIGHSYFIEAKTDLDIFNALKDCVIPLLEEYFYNDAQKIRQILNETSESENNFYVKDSDAMSELDNMQNDYDNEKELYILNPVLTDVKDNEKAKSFINHIVSIAE